MTAATYQARVPMKFDARFAVIFALVAWVIIDPPGAYSAWQFVVNLSILLLEALQQLLILISEL